ADARAMVDVERAVIAQAAERIVRQGREMHHRVEAAKIGRRHVANVLADRGDGTAVAAERAVFVKVGVQPCNIVARACEHIHHDGPDVSVVAGDEHLHKSDLLWKLGIAAYSVGWRGFSKEPATYPVREKTKCGTTGAAGPARPLENLQTADFYPPLGRCLIAR